MPTPILLVLLILVGTYGVLAGAVSVGGIRARRQTPPPPPPEWPSVSVVGRAVEDPDPSPLQQIQACDYPTDRLELLLPTAESTEDSSPERDGALSVRRVSVPERPPSALASAPPDSILGEAEGEIMLSMPAGEPVPPDWIRSMVRRCTEDTPVVVGPTLVEHEDLFLPRLQALSHLGHLTFTAAASEFDRELPSGNANRAVRVGSRRDTRLSSDKASVTFNPDPGAAVLFPPARSFGSLLRHYGHGFSRLMSASSWLVRGPGLVLWGVHTVLLACALVAVAVPAWRQPTLLAVVAKMGADVLLTLPTAKHYDQRTLFRSLVPTELMLVLALPLGGLWSFMSPEHLSGSRSL
ncbi:MAG: hypothetical protein ABEL51_00185 [Salinibacter sp.]